MNPTFRKLAGVVAEGLLLALCVAAIPLILTQDRFHFHYGSSEHSLTEIIQALLVMFSAAAFWFARKWHPQASAWLILVTGFFGVILIREMDYHFDIMIAHGFWVYPALAVTIATVIASYRAEGSVRAGLLEFSNTPAYVFVLCGLIIVLFFSRLMGAGAILESLMGAEYNRHFKTALQEGLELMGYLLAAWGAGRYLISRP